MDLACIMRRKSDDDERARLGKAVLALTFAMVWRNTMIRHNNTMSLMAEDSLGVEIIKSLSTSSPSLPLSDKLQTLSQEFAAAISASAPRPPPRTTCGLTLNPHTLTHAPFRPGPFSLARGPSTRLSVRGDTGKHCMGNESSLPVICSHYSGISWGEEEEDDTRARRDAAPCTRGMMVAAVPRWAW